MMQDNKQYYYDYDMFDNEDVPNIREQYRNVLENKIIDLKVDKTSFVMELQQKLAPIIKELDTPYPQDSKMIMMRETPINYKGLGGIETTWYIRTGEVSLMIATIIEFAIKNGCPELEEATQELLKILEECGGRENEREEGSKRRANIV
jgi:hypothetical protein